MSSPVGDLGDNAFISIPFDVDPDAIVDRALQFLALMLPGWQPSDGHVEVWLAQALARISMEVGAVAAQVPPGVFANFGRDFMGISQIPSDSAVMTSTWTTIDDAGYTIPEGTVVAYRQAGDTLVAFRSTTDVVILPGNTSTLPGEVGLRAQETGPNANGIPAGSPLELIDSLNYVDSISVQTESAGGVDTEPDSLFLDRLRAELQLMTPRPILPRDFAVLAKRIAGVTRALAINNYNPYANLMTYQQSTIEGNADAWASVTNCSVARTLSWSAEGPASLAVTTTSAGDCEFATNASVSLLRSDGSTYPYVTAGWVTRANTVARNQTISLLFYNGATLVSTVEVGTFLSNVSEDISFYDTVAVPAGATSALMHGSIDSAGVAEVHRFDKFGVMPARTSTLDSEWTPGGKMYDAERAITIVPVGPEGEPISELAKQNLVAYLQSQREVNFIVSVVDPFYTTIDASFTIRVLDGFDSAEVLDRAEAALAAYLSPANFAGGDLNPPIWRTGESKIRFLPTSAVLQAVRGVQYVASLTLNGGVADISLPGLAALPRAGTVSGGLA